MPAVSDEVTLSLRFPRSAIENIISMSESLNDRMHQLLERNTEGDLTDVEREELETLVEIAQFGQLIALSLRPGPTP